VLNFQALRGLAGGIALVAAPDGSVMKMPVSSLEGSPFSDYLVPGLILLLVLGVVPIVAAIVLLLRPRAGWSLAFAVGCGLIIWLVVEITIIPFSWLQPAYGVVAATIVILALLKPVRSYCGMRLLG
jgi:hypothetical protein